MKNPAPYIRRRLFELLDGNVSYESQQIPVYEGEGKDVGRLILIGEYSDGDSSNKHNFGATAYQVIEVVCVQKDSARKHADAIGELVMNLIHPQPTSNLLSGTDFTVNVIGKPSINHLIENSGSGQKVVRLIMRFNFLIDQS